MGVIGTIFKPNQMGCRERGDLSITTATTTINQDAPQHDQPAPGRRLAPDAGGGAGAHANWSTALRPTRHRQWGDCTKIVRAPGRHVNQTPVASSSRVGGAFAHGWPTGPDCAQDRPPTVWTHAPYSILSLPSVPACKAPPTTGMQPSKTVGPSAGTLAVYLRRALYA